MRSAFKGTVALVIILSSLLILRTKATPTVKVLDDDTRRVVIEAVGAVSRGEQGVKWADYPVERVVKEAFGTGKILLWDRSQNNKYRPTAKKDEVILNVSMGVQGVAVLLSFGKMVLELRKEVKKAKEHIWGPAPPEVYNFKKAILVISPDFTPGQEQRRKAEAIKTIAEFKCDDYFNKVVLPKKTQEEKLAYILDPKNFPNLSSQVQLAVTAINSRKSSTNNDFEDVQARLKEIMLLADGTLEIITLVYGDHLTKLTTAPDGKERDFSKVLYMFEGAENRTDSTCPKDDLLLETSRYVKCNLNIHCLTYDILAFKTPHGNAGLRDSRAVPSDATVSITGLYPNKLTPQFLVICDRTETVLTSKPRLGYSPPGPVDYIVAFVGPTGGVGFYGAYKDLGVLKASFGVLEYCTTITTVSIL